MSELTARRGRTVELDRLVVGLQRYGVYAALLVLLVYDVLTLDRFATMSNVRVQLDQAVPILVIALGMALVIGTEGIDLSVGAVVALSSAFVPLYLGYGAGFSIVAALVAGAVTGVLAGLMVAVVNVQPIVATLSLMIGVRGIAVILNGASAKQVIDPTILGLGSDQILDIPKMAWIALVLALVVGFVVRYTRFGRQLVAIGDNRRASQLAGLPVKRVLVTVYVVSGVLAALAGLLVTGYGAEADPSNYGLNFELSAITAVVVGGTPLSGGRIRVLGTVAGALFMQLVTATLVQNNVATSYAQMVEAAIICVAVYLARGKAAR
ncbi:monosaccharide ABC transporter membrane protein, CUT2 family [Jatrophihabitans endophyticus]|uniref:Monosaccharide ABC transporter membrane protein, CUT2 family n=1 Tax=Jatrophihabitans endophyticus TaxID=1206085 RepID=A0A1M5PBK1_9ACTN|nr:ABC transporter permease [Jatrophihabitans endophyticus]SHG99112.1 monosaccharide ABC transporter membrane protein, CUT2 family [Jatrophihabitans endophyticus]